MDRTYAVLALCALVMAKPPRFTAIRNWRPRERDAVVRWAQRELAARAIPGVHPLPAPRVLIPRSC